MAFNHLLNLKRYNTVPSTVIASSPKWRLVRPKSKYLCLCSSILPACTRDSHLQNPPTLRSWSSMPSLRWRRIKKALINGYYVSTWPWPRHTLSWTLAWMPKLASQVGRQAYINSSIFLLHYTSAENSSWKLSTLLRKRVLNVGVYPDLGMDLRNVKKPYEKLLGSWRHYSIRMDEPSRATPYTHHHRLLISFQIILDLIIYYISWSCCLLCDCMCIAIVTINKFLVDKYG